MYHACIERPKFDRYLLHEIPKCFCKRCCTACCCLGSLMESSIREPLQLEGKTFHRLQSHFVHEYKYIKYINILYGFKNLQERPNVTCPKPSWRCTAKYIYVLVIQYFWRHHKRHFSHSWMSFIFSLSKI